MRKATDSDVFGEGFHLILIVTGAKKDGAKVTGTSRGDSYVEGKEGILSFRAD